MGGLSDSTATVLVQEHSQRGFDVHTYPSRLSAALQLIRTHMTRSKIPEADMVSILHELKQMAEDHCEIEFPAEIKS